MTAPQGPGGGWDGGPYGGVYPGYGGHPPPRPAANLPEEAATGTRAATALWFGVACYVVGLVANVIYFHEFWKVFDKMLSTTTTTRGRTVTPSFQLSGTAIAAQGVGLVASLATWVVGILFLIWFHRALTNAQSLGIPQRRTPGWGIAGFFIPIGNFFLPYQSAVDLFPPDHPDRGIVRRWWAFWLTAQLSSSVVLFAAFASLELAMALALVIAVLYVFAAVSGRDMIARSTKVHEEWAAALPAPQMPTGSPPPGYPPTGAPMPPAGSPPAATEPRDPWAPN